MSISTTNKRVLFFLPVVLGTLLCFVLPATAKEPITLEQRVARLGFAGNDDISDVKELATNPRVSTGLLVAGLHTIADSEKAAKEDGPSMEHVLWIIRALRYLTGGKDFCATTKHTFGRSYEEANRKYWLTFGHKNCVLFFSIWPSRDRTYVAPLDAQHNIIGQWRHWYANSGAAFEYKPLQDPAPEKWLW